MAQSDAPPPDEAAGLDSLFDSLAFASCLSAPFSADFSDSRLRLAVP